MPGRPPVLIRLAAAGLALGAAGAASGAIEPILYSDGPIPGVTVGGNPATIWQSGLFRPRNSPDRSRWAIRVNQTSANDNEYIVVGSGLTGQTAVHSSLDTASVPTTSAGVFFISERGLSINDAGSLAVSGSTTARAVTDTIWRITPGATPTIDTVVRENDVLFPRPAGGTTTGFTNIGGPTITNTGKVAFGDETLTTANIEIAVLWDAGAYSLLKSEGDAFTNAEVAGRLLENVGPGEANLFRGAVFYHENVGSDPIFGLQGDLAGTATDDQFFAVRDQAGDTIIAREGTSIGGRALGAAPIGWIDPAGNTYVVSNGTTDMYAYLNGTLVAEVGGPVGGTVPGETWTSAQPVFGHSPVIALDRNAAGGYIIGGMTSNTETFLANDAAGNPTATSVTRNQVIIYVAPDGTRTELVRTGDSVTVDVGGAPQTRRIVTLGQQDATLASYVDDTHLYFLAGTEFFAGSIPDDLYARVALPTTTGPTTQVCCRGATCAVIAAADCTAPAGIGVRVLDASQTSCTGQSAVGAGCCYADFNKSGEKDVADIFAYLSAWFADSTFADVGGDGTGTRDVSDIFGFLSVWFAGCS